MHHGRPAVVSDCANMETGDSRWVSECPATAGRHVQSQSDIDPRNMVGIDFRAAEGAHVVVVVEDRPHCLPADLPFPAALRLASLVHSPYLHCLVYRCCSIHAALLSQRCCMSLCWAHRPCLNPTNCWRNVISRRSSCV